MNPTISHAPGGYRFIPGVFQYSGGVAAESGYCIERVRWHRPLPLEEAFVAAEKWLIQRGRTVDAFCACELRSPAPFSEDAFESFNRVYVGALGGWGVIRDGINPVARTNVCPVYEPPQVPSMFAFSYTVPAPADAVGSFVVSGSGEAPEGKATYRDHIVARGDVSPAGLVLKARWVLTEMERRMGLLGFHWSDATAPQLYTIHNPHPLLAETMAERQVLAPGLMWHYCRPPVVEIEFEMDVRAVHRELVV